MKKLLVSSFLLGGILIACAEKQPVPAIPSDPEIEGKIEKLLKNLTLEEKIGQMCELTIGVITDKSGQKLSEDLLDTVIGKYKVGSILNIPFGVSQKKEVFADVITQIQKKSLEEIRIPCIYGLDQIHGASYTQDATFFPQGINMAAAFNRELTKRCAEITAYETRACCVSWTYAPVMDLGRDPRWPRMWESFGEDAYVNAQMAVQAVRGLQGDNPNKVDKYHISSCIKHFMGYGVPVSGKDRTPSSITDIDLREKHFAPFLAAIRAGALSLMVNSGNNNGMPFHANKELLTGWLKEDLNWDGMIVTDWNDINNLYFRDQQYEKFGSEEFAKVALQAAEESEVLLKNDGGILPLREGMKILLAGPNANAMRCLNGGWSYSWQGERADEFAQTYHTIYEALCNRFGANNIIYEPGVTYAPAHHDNWWEENKPEIGKAVAAAHQADVIVACIGENTYCETPGNLNDLHLSSNQIELVKALATTGKPIILILNEGRPRIIREIEPLAKAVVHILLPGNYGGDALANLISGDRNFSGRLPFTYPKFINSLATYDYKPCEKMGTMEGEYNYDAVMDIQWPFGHGLSYTEFEYGNFRVNRTNFTADDDLIFEVDVKNTGERVGKETVMLYSSDLVASVTPDVIRLRHFDKIELQPGEMKKVVFKLKGSDLAFVGYDKKWRLEKGRFRMKCGSEVLYINCEKDKIWNTPNIN